MDNLLKGISMNKAVELQTGWFTRQKNIHHKYRMTIDEMLLCWNYAVMMKQRGLSLSDIANHAGCSKEAVRQWFERGLPDHSMQRLDAAISALAPMDPPTGSMTTTWQNIMFEGWMLSQSEHQMPGHAGGMGLRAETEKEMARRNRLPELAKAQSARARARTHCKRGHEFTPENTRLRPPKNWRQCITCARAYEAARRARFK
jgi:hypothetical protein